MGLKFKLVICLLLASVSLIAKEHTPNMLFERPIEIACIPHEFGVAGAFSGLSNDALVVAGGSWFSSESGPRIYGDSIYVCVKKRGEFIWRVSGTLPSPVAYGASVQTTEGILCLGGENDEIPSAKVYMLKWNPENGSVSFDEYPDLPAPATKLSAALIDKTVYVISGKRFWRFDLQKREWQTLPDVPFVERQGAVMVSQNNGFNECLYLIGGKGEYYRDDMWSYDPSQPENHRWESLPATPYPLSSAPALSYGDSQLFVFSGSTGSDMSPDGEFKFPKDILSFNTETKTWSVAGELDQGKISANAILWDGKVFIPGGEIRPKVRTNNVVSIMLKDKSARTFSVWSAALIGCLLLILSLSVVLSRRTKSKKR